MGFFSKPKKAEPSPEPAENDVQLSAFILFSESLTFRPKDIGPPLREDFPEMDWVDDAFVDAIGGTIQSTNDLVMAQIATGAGLKPALLNNMPGFNFYPNPQQLMASRYSADEASALIENSNTYLNVAVWAPRSDLALRVEAARRLAAIVSVFAGLPIATAVIWHPSGRVIKPAQMALAADTLRAGEAPIMETTLPLYGTDPNAPETVTARTQGFQAFIDAEIEIIQSPMDLNTTVTASMVIGKMATELGHQFADGHTMSGPESEESDETFRIRYADAAKHPTGRAHWVLVHKDSPFDHVKAYGKLKKAAGKRKQRSDMGWFKRQMSRSSMQ